MKLLDQVRRLALETERCYVRWIEHFIRFHKTAEGFRHPNTMGAEEVERFLTFLAVQRHVSARTQNLAFAAVLALVPKLPFGNAVREAPVSRLTPRPQPPRPFCTSLL